MDLFAGNEPRKFISFHLDKEQTGQPLQEAEQAPEQDASDANTAGSENTRAQLILPEQETANSEKDPIFPADFIKEPMDTQAFEPADKSSTGDSNTSFGTAIENLAMDQQSNEPNTNVCTHETNRQML